MSLPDLAVKGAAALLNLASPADKWPGSAAHIADFIEGRRGAVHHTMADEALLQREVEGLSPSTLFIKWWDLDVVNASDVLDRDTLLHLSAVINNEGDDDIEMIDPLEELPELKTSVYESIPDIDEPFIDQKLWSFEPYVQVFILSIALGGDAYENLEDPDWQKMEIPENMMEVIRLLRIPPSLRVIIEEEAPDDCREFVLRELDVLAHTWSLDHKVAGTLAFHVPSVMNLPYFKGTSYMSPELHETWQVLPEKHQVTFQKRFTGFSFVTQEAILTALGSSATDLDPRFKWKLIASLAALFSDVEWLATYVETWIFPENWQLPDAVAQVERVEKALTRIDTWTWALPDGFWEKVAALQAEAEAMYRTALEEKEAELAIELAETVAERAETAAERAETAAKTEQLETKTAEFEASGRELEWLRRVNRRMEWLLLTVSEG